MQRKLWRLAALAVVIIGSIVATKVRAPISEQFTVTPFVAGEKISTTAPSLQFFGDIMLDRNVAKAMGKQGLSYIFVTATGTKQIFVPAEMHFANLEGPFAPARIATSKSIAFRFDPTFASQLKQFDFTGFNLANNHSYDMGSKNVTFTRKTLAQAGLGYFGDELNEGPAYTLFTTSTDGTIIAFLGVHNTYHEPNLKKLATALQQARAAAAIVIVNVHWGVEYRTTSTKKQQTLAHWLINNGADAVIGHHPHVIEEAEVYHGKPIFYSLGNFIFDQYFSKETQEGLSVILQTHSGKITSAVLLPFFSVHSQVQAMTGDRREQFFDWLKAVSRFNGAQFVGGTLTL